MSQTACNSPIELFQVKNKPVIISPTGATVSSNGGFLAIHRMDEKMGLLDGISAAFVDGKRRRAEAVRDLGRIRVSAELSQEEFAKKLKISKSHLCDIEKGRKFLSAEKRIWFRSSKSEQLCRINQSLGVIFVQILNSGTHFLNPFSSPEPVFFYELELKRSTDLPLIGHTTDKQKGDVEVGIPAMSVLFENGKWTF